MNRMAENSQQLRERAQKLLDQASPQQRKQLEDLARELAQNNPGNQDRPSAPRDSIDPTSNPPDGTPSGSPGSQTRSPAVASRAVRQPSSPTQTVPVDARASAREGRQRTISEIISNDQTPREASATGTTLDEAMREAAEGAQAGIETRSVPNDRTELVRRVFQRYQQRAQQTPTTPQPAKPKPPAPDAKPAGSTSSSGGGTTK